MVSDRVFQRILPLNDRNLCPYQDVLTLIFGGDSTFLNYSSFP